MVNKWLAFSFMFCFSILIANDEFKIKRENVFTFKSEPTVVDENGKAKITFETDGFCDVTIVIEDENGQIIRHLASGVLGDNAPEPFQSKTKNQTVYWDYKNDAGMYPITIDKLNVRVSLGIKPQFERTLFWSAEKRINRQNATIVLAVNKGVLVYEGEGVDQLKLFSRDGQYIKTIYPFAAKDVNQVKALTFLTMPQSGKSLPQKFGHTHQSTFLKTGTNMNLALGKYGQAANTLVAYGDKIGLIGQRLGVLTLGTDFENVAVDGPDLTVKYKNQGKEDTIAPRSAAISPDGKWIYLAGYMNNHFVKKIAFNKDGKPEIFAGKADGSHGQGDTEFNGAASVAVDPQGRVYVADYCNDRIQVLSEKGEFLKSIKFPSPNLIQINPQNGDIYVSSWLALYSNYAKDGPEPQLVNLGNFDNPVEKARFKLPFVDYSKGVFMNHNNWTFFNVHIDFFDKQPVFWVLPGRVGTNSDLWIARGLKINPTEATAMKLFVADGNNLKKIGDFGPAVASAVKRFTPPIISRQRMYVNPKNEKLYVAEGDSGVMKSFQELIEIDPATGKVNIVKLPFTTEDLCFDHNGLIYLRTDLHVMRFDPHTWKEIPFDYGIEQEEVGFEPRKMNPPAMSVINLPTSGKPGQFHLGGMAINHKLNLVISCYNSKHNVGEDGAQEGSLDYKTSRKGGSGYKPQTYPGRVSYAEIHIWDSNGKLMKEDVFPGLGITDGIAIDNDNNVYVMADGARVIDGKRFWDRCTSTIIKGKPGEVKVLSESKRVEVPLAGEMKPKRDHDIESGSIGGAWVEKAEWFYGGVGFAGFSSGHGSACACWNSRFTLDALKRTFAPEIAHFTIAVLDSNGNVITRVGQYGNVDDGVPLIKEGGPKNPVSIGGDEVALFHAAYVATHTDKRLFIADSGNSRIMSVKIDYDTHKKVPVKVVRQEK